MSKKTTIIYDSWGKIALALPDDQAGELFKAICSYSFDDEESQISNPTLSAIFAMIKAKLDENAEEYAAKVERMNRINNDRKDKSRDDNATTSSQSRHEVVTKSEQCHDDIEGESVSVSDSVSVSVSDSVSDKKRESARARFTPPTVAEVQDYCRERGNGIDADRFVDFYESKGWKVGSSPMKNWKAAVRTWEQRNTETARSGTTNELDAWASA